MLASIDPALAALYEDLPRLDLADMAAVRAAEMSIAAGDRPDMSGGVEEVPILLDTGDRTVQAVLHRGVNTPGTGLIVHVHGGGFVVGSARDSHTRRWCSQTARRTGAAVLAVDYRLAPEHPYPAGHDDCLGAVVWAAAHSAELGFTPGIPIILHGQSAGGALAAGVAIRLRDEGRELLAGLILDAPVVDDRLAFESMRASRGGPVWTIDEATHSWRHYLAGRNPVPSYAAPGRAGSYEGLPPTFISVNALDALRDEALDLGRRMAADGVSVDLRMYAGTLHGSALVGMDVAAGETINRDQYEAMRVMMTAHTAVVRERGVG